MPAFRHHFVPQGYLRGFSTDEAPTDTFIWVYDKQAQRAPRKKSVRSIAWASAYYAQEKEDGTLDLDTLETALATTIDNDIPSILRLIKPTAGKVVALAEEDRATLAFFIGISLTRVPSFREGINDMHSQIAQIALSRLTEVDPTLGELINNNNVKAVAKSWVSLKPMIEMAQAVAQSLLRKNWQFYMPTKDMSLVTSDNPVIFSGAAIGLTQIGPAHPGAEVVMNLRKDLAIVCTPKSGYPHMSAFQLSPADTRKFNRGIVRAAKQRVFADRESKTFDQFVKKYAGEEQRIIS